MKRLITLFVSAIVLAGCGSISVPKSNMERGSFYSIDLQKLVVCHHLETDCLSLSSLASYHHPLDGIAAEYGQPEISGPNIPLSIARLMVNPPDQRYTAEQRGETGRFYRVPINASTNKIWAGLRAADDNLAVR
ncbi:hypothetical protein [Nitrincola sp. MINF-07-Sa-05]|uniref:hypothetical protein n=1 Tax=Nitrincola salilacus TaxID=3400273 RepID=UPI003917FF2E